MINNHNEIKSDDFDDLQLAKIKASIHLFEQVLGGDVGVVSRSGEETATGNSLFRYYSNSLRKGLVSYASFHEATETGICRLFVGEGRGDSVVVKPIYADVESGPRVEPSRIRQWFDSDSEHLDKLPQLERIISGPFYFDTEGRRGEMLVKQFVPGPDYSKLLYMIMAALGAYIPTVVGAEQSRSTKEDLMKAGEMLYLDYLQRVYLLQTTLPSIDHPPSSVLTDMQNRCCEVVGNIVKHTDVDLTPDENTAYTLSIRNLGMGSVVREDTLRRNVAATFRNIIRPNGDAFRIPLDEVVTEMMLYQSTVSNDSVRVGEKSPVIVDVPFPYKNSHFLEDVAELDGSYEASFIPQERRRQFYEKVFTRASTTPQVGEEESRLIHLYRDLRKVGIYIHYFGARNFTLLARKAGMNMEEYERRNELYLLNIHHHLGRVVENTATLIGSISRRLEERHSGKLGFSEQMESLDNLHTRTQRKGLTQELAREFCELFRPYEKKSRKTSPSTTANPWQTDILRLASVMYLNSFARKVDGVSALVFNYSNLHY